MRPCYMLRLNLPRFAMCGRSNLRIFVMYLSRNLASLPWASVHFPQLCYVRCSNLLSFSMYTLRIYVALPFTPLQITHPCHGPRLTFHSFAVCSVWIFPCAPFEFTNLFHVPHSKFTQLWHVSGFNSRSFFCHALRSNICSLAMCAVRIAATLPCSRFEFA